MFVFGLKKHRLKSLSLKDADSQLILAVIGIIDKNKNSLPIFKFWIRLHSMEHKRNFHEISIIYSVSKKYIL